MSASLVASFRRVGPDNGELIGHDRPVNIGIIGRLFTRQMDATAGSRRNAASATAGPQLFLQSDNQQDEVYYK
jgi:hypothetical protein